MSELKYGVNVENLLYDLSQHESDDIGEFDFYCEDEHGREGSATIDITLLASDALKLITELKAQRDALAAENASKQEFIESRCWVYDDEEQGYRDAVNYVPETPATDAYLNSVRAEGVEMAVGELKDLAQRSEAEAPIAAERIHAAALYLMIFAAQLRAGKDGE